MNTINLDCNVEDYDTLEKALPDVITLLDKAADIMAHVIHIPKAEPDDPIWNDFWDKPFVDRAVHAFSMIFDASTNAQSLLDNINNAVPSA